MHIPDRRVLHVQRASGIGGSERHLLSLLPTLEARGWKSAICVAVVEDGARFVEALRSAGIETVAFPAGPHVNPALAPKLLREIRRVRPDLVHTHLIHGDLYGQIAARLAGIPAVSSAHSTLRFYRSEPYRSASRLAWRLARRVIAISTWVARFLVEVRLATQERIRIVHYGIDAGSWALGAEDRIAARTAFGIASHEIAIGIASRLIPLKGHDSLLAAFHRAESRVPNLRLLIAGNGPLRESLQAKARSELPKSSVRFLGFIPDVPRFMSACDVIVFPTLPELG
ncbi:MAG: glycosyltransferase, partial [Candidatus Binatia bacterium]